MKVEDVIRDMEQTANAHAQWALSPDATSQEAGISTAFAAQLRRWIAALRAADGARK